jgi:hypothetical protein
MQALQGRVSGQADLQWNADGFDGKGNLVLQNLSFRREGMQLEGIDVNLALDHLAPLRSLSGQQLKIRRVGAGVDMTNIDVTFQLDAPEGIVRLMADALAMETLGGRITAQDATIIPTEGDAALRLNVANLNLSTLINEIGFEELQAEGRLNGVLPVRMEDGGVAISGAELVAQGTGRIQFRSPDSRQALASGGEPVKLMFDALEDFRYDTLRMTIDKPIQGDTRIFLQLNGRNPAVLDGQVFHLNINLTGNADPILTALAEGQRLRNQVMQPLFRLQPSPAPVPAR